MLLSLWKPFLRFVMLRVPSHCSFYVVYVCLVRFCYAVVSLCLSAVTTRSARPIHPLSLSTSTTGSKGTEGNAAPARNDTRSLSSTSETPHTQSRQTLQEEPDESRDDSAPKNQGAAPTPTNPSSTKASSTFGAGLSRRSSARAASKKNQQNSPLGID